MEHRFLGYRAFGFGAAGLILFLELVESPVGDVFNPCALSVLSIEGQELRFLQTIKRRQFVN
jgi:hypothetical protein